MNTIRGTFLSLVLALTGTRLSHSTTQTVTNNSSSIHFKQLERNATMHLTDYLIRLYSYVPINLIYIVTISSAFIIIIIIVFVVQYCSKKNSTKPQRRLHAERGVCGLRNIGNTCYMNSAIQCLSHIPQLTAWCLQHNPNRNKKLVQAYCQLIQKMWSGRYTCVDPYLLKQVVGDYASLFNDYAQKDSHEFLNTLLNALSNEGMVLVNKLFTVYTQTRVICSHCQMSASHRETTTFLPLTLKAETGLINLGDLFDDFLREEKLDGDYYCQKCDGFYEAKQKTSLQLPLPPLLILQLRRFTLNSSNNRVIASVRYPLENFCLSKYIANDYNEVKPIIYNLVAVSIHVGSLQYGHYTAYARLDGNGSWYHFDDQLVHEIHASRVISEDAYVDSVCKLHRLETVAN